MKQTKTYCDTCGVEIKEGYGIDKGELKLVGTSKTTVDRIAWDDLCHACTTKLFDLLHRFKGGG